MYTVVVMYTDKYDISVRRKIGIHGQYSMIFINIHTVFTGLYGRVDRGSVYLLIRSFHGYAIFGHIEQ